MLLASHLLQHCYLVLVIVLPMNLLFEEGPGMLVVFSQRFVQ